MKTKLQYQLSARTTMKDNQLKEKILSEFREYGYNIVDFKEDTIYFALKGWGLSGSQVGKADAGTVENIEFENGNTIILTYNINLIYNLLSLVFLVFFVFYFDWMVLFLVFGLILFTFLNLVITKTNHRELLMKITNMTADNIR